MRKCETIFEDDTFMKMFHLSLALYYPGGLLFNLASSPSLNATISLARATSQSLAVAPDPRKWKRNAVEREAGVKSFGQLIMRAFDFKQAGKEGKQGVIVGIIGIGAFLEKQFTEVWPLFCIVSLSLSLSVSY